LDAVPDQVKPVLNDPRGGHRGWMYNLLLSAVAFALMLPLTELAVRLIAPQPASWLDIYRCHPMLPFYVLQETAYPEHSGLG
jgi:hypothetical protein